MRAAALPLLVAAVLATGAVLGAYPWAIAAAAFIAYLVGYGDGLWWARRSRVNEAPRPSIFDEARRWRRGVAAEPLARGDAVVIGPDDKARAWAPPEPGGAP